MKKRTSILSLFVLMVLGIGFLQSCKNKEPSTIKIYVRSASNELVTDAKVVIIGDPSSNPPTLNYVDTLLTNGSGFAAFDVQPYFDEAGEDNSVAYFDVVVKTSTKTAYGEVRSRVHTTAVETIFLPN